MFIIILLKLQILFLRTFTRNSGTALPGLWLEKYFPNTLKKLLAQLETVVLITGTNGKTTTSKMLGHLLKQNNTGFIANTSGSNLIRGIASTLIQNTNYLGKLSSKIAIFEVEEATMPKLVKLVKPNVIVVTNIFRDQLDAYGEIDKTYEYIKNAIKDSENPDLILNYDDERVRSLAEYTSKNISFVALDKKYLVHIKSENKGKFVGKANKGKIYKIKSINEIDEKTFFQTETEDALLEDTIQIPGIHNTLNAISAQLAFSILKRSELVELKEENLYNFDLSNLEAAFGRGEKLKYKNTEFEILLVKNPAGMNLNLQYLSQKEEIEAILFILNDNIADGKDVSWIWDCDFDLLKDSKVKHIYVAGKRRYDMALRIQYAGLELHSPSKEGEIENSIEEAIKVIANTGLKKVYVLPTYTAMLEFRNELSKVAKVKEIWR